MCSWLLAARNDDITVTWFCSQLLAVVTQTVVLLCCYVNSILQRTRVITLVTEDLTSTSVSADMLMRHMCDFA